MKTKVKTKKASSHKSKDKVQDYYAELDLMTWWESFNGDCSENGCYKYKTVWSFICAKTKLDWQRRFLYWILGPLGTPGDEYKKYQQFDWLTRREKGHWYNSENAEKLSQSVKDKQNALEAMKEVGSINIKFISRLEALAEEIDREYSGRLFLAGLSSKENNLRAQTYTALLQRLQNMIQQAQLMYGKTMGMDLERLDSFFAMFAKGMGSAVTEQMGFAGSNTIEGQSPVSNTLQQISKMILDKAAERELDLPDKDMEGIILNATKPQLVKTR